MTEGKPVDPRVNRILQLVCATDIVMGVIIMAGADDWWPEIPELAYGGAVLAATGAGLMLWLRYLARKEERRRKR